MRGIRGWAAAAALMTLLGGAARADTLTVRADRAVHGVSPTLYGIFLEDINCAVDGGLSAELVRNPSFENENLFNPQRADHWDAWRIQKKDGAGAEIAGEGPLHANNPSYLRVTLGEGGSVTAVNQGFGGNAFRGGIPLREGMDYDFSMQLRADADAEVSVALTDIRGNSLAGEKAVWRLPEDVPAGAWTEVRARFTAESAASASLSIVCAGSGRIDLDCVSLLPGDRFGADWPGGGLRADLVETLRELRPRFLRFPGGCVVEGTARRENAYDWKDSVGPRTARRQIANTWGGVQTMNVGFYEYFCLSEALGALPVPVVHAGLLCQAREVKDPPLTLEETAAYARDLLDLIEFATGDASTEWGALRAEMGHPEPFDLRYLAIGNENWGAAYFNRYEVLRSAVKEAYPEITCIVAAGPVAEGGLIQDSWSQIRRRFPEDLVDEHYYMESGWFPKHVSRYDRYPRTTRVFLGEYAAHEPVQGGTRPGTLYAALCEAAYLTGIERNGDLIEMCCYAPLLCREGAVDWTPDLIWFNDGQICRTASFWVQKLYADALGDTLVESTLEGGIFQVATRTERELQIKLVNLSEDPVPLVLRLPGVPDQRSGGERLSGRRVQANSLTKPDTLTPQPAAVELRDGEAQTELPAWSLTILKFALEQE